jgi:hypothetical protein
MPASGRHDERLLHQIQKTNWPCVEIRCRAPEINLDHLVKFAERGEHHFPADELEAIDRHAEAHGYTRSGFLTLAAKHEMQKKGPASKQLAAVMATKSFFMVISFLTLPLPLLQPAD